MSQKVSILFPLIIALSSCVTNSSDDRSAEKSLADLKVYPGLKVTLFAAEPMFSNPTNIAVDARGRVWVCEAYNYRNQLNPKNPERKEGDRIMILEDTDGDGKADRSKVFYQGTDVNAALGICVLGNKIIVSCSPNVFVFTDSNGDDVPDSKEVLFTGIRGEQHDHGMHTFIFGPDGRLYFNMGNEGKVLLTAAADTVVDIHGRSVRTDGKPFRQGMALRCEMDGSNVEVLGHNFRNNYELAADPFGTIWQSDNDDDGNKGTRINYVMEQGNFGYTDEMTGAGWSARRTNMETEIPLRHWHLNDPGVVPNVLQTGSGSPAGIMIYEGDLLPVAFHGKIIHAEPGHNVVRAYDVSGDGAGYKAEIVNLLEGQQDQWFRPVDVAAGPDGSLFIADWYDPGVGGHQVGDLDRGRIYRITGGDTEYRRKTYDFSQPEKAVAALVSPNSDLRYQGWKALSGFGDDAEDALRKLWTSDDARKRATAFWLLARTGNSSQYFQEAFADKDPDIRILAIRAAKQLRNDVANILNGLAEDPDPQVRREAALSLYGLTTPDAAKVWATLARQYDGRDRWYLEALGIGATGNSDRCFDAWKKSVGDSWRTGVNRDIVWRSRSREAIPMLATLIREASEQEMLRYFRAFDFHSDPSKQQILAKLALESKDAKVLFALKHMKPSPSAITPALRATVERVMKQYNNRLEFVELAAGFGLTGKANDLLALAVALPDSAAGREAAKTLLSWDRADLFQRAFDSGDKKAMRSVVKALWPHMYSQKAMTLMERFLTDTTKDVEVRKLAVRTFAGPWEAEDRLVQLARNKQIPNDLQTAAAGVFQTAWRASIREDGARYLRLPGSKEGASLPAVAVLAERKGDAEKGREVFTNVCANCHAVNNEGVNFGPDLGEIGDKLSREALYTSILFPDQGISFGYEGHRFSLRDGSQAFGRIVSETEDEIELQYINTRQTIRKSDVTSRETTETSLMPANLQSLMTEQELVDLVEYLSTLTRSPK